MTISEDNFESVVLASPVPVLVHFWAPWCGLCRRVTPMLSRFQQDWSGQVNVFNVNADENLKLANLYRLQTLPTLLFLDQGQVVQRFDVLRNRDEFMRALNLLMRRYQLDNSFAAEEAGLVDS
ncbi:thioredoxin domain-containing protein [Leptolyngbya sp. Heron Island J]|uniref:thioredoxin family protein n=1 Tax=Leptolyngbya sp. Heron Island J TaxID=1385935 RepID=UPI0003B9CE87|nr:thioredoxin domain-containing protein [Leptolyngbya sp. Heron Island J]ESA33300.1 thioredoxin domain-containing protein [Leptolyngbya sp. Heron Island J]